ncbi:UNVERIFIED_CONTAM: hypothetical protein FKN15_053478 [Acipenser sinensis]
MDYAALSALLEQLGSRRGAEERRREERLSPQPGSPALCFTPAFPASVTLSFPQHGHPNA